jgi:hypothetical protein
MRAKQVTTGDGGRYGVRFDCPGCKAPHVVPTEPTANGWGFNGDLALPTLTPSVLVYEVRIKADADPATVVPPFKPGDVYSPRCHSFVRDGRIEFLGDCGHALAGQTVDLPEIESASPGGAT